MALSAFVLILLIGGVVGLVAGLVGVGGGIVMVPVLYLLLSRPEWAGIALDPQLQVVVAHATSLFVAVPTSISAVVAYRRADLVVWQLAVPLGLGAAAGAVAGAQVAVSLPPELLKALFGVLLVAAGVRLLRSKKKQGGGDLRRIHPAVIISLGLGIGFIASMLGVGGGIVAIPFLIYLLRIPLNKVAATSMGMVMFVAIAATISYGLAGFRVDDMGTWMVGFVYAPAGLALMPGAVVGARLGARLNQRMNVRALQIMFAVVFVVLGVRLSVLNALALIG